MSIEKNTRADKLAWAAAFPASGLTAKAYAAAAGCSVAKLYYWRRHLVNDEGPARFTPITISDEVAAPSLYLRLPGGLEVHGTPVQLVAFVHQLRDDA